MVEGRRRRRAGASNGAVFLVALFLLDTGCNRSHHPATSHEPSGTLTVGFGLASGQSSQGGLRQVIRTVGGVLERLVNVARDGRPQAGVFERWSTSSDGLAWEFYLRRGVAFHDGTHLTAAMLRDLLEKQLPDYLGPAMKDIARIQAVSETQLEFSL